MKKPRARKKASPAMGVAWYRESDWPRVKSEFSDAEDLHDTYADWLQSAEAVVRHLGQSGGEVQRYLMDIDHFIHWCWARGCGAGQKAPVRHLQADRTPRSSPRARG